MTDQSTGGTTATTPNKNKKNEVTEQPPLSSHFSEDILQYEYENDIDSKIINNNNNNIDIEKSRAIRRASRRVSTRESITGSPFDVSYHPTSLILYSRPRQRQQWGEDQVLPRVNWGDLFFDLFYVAAAYNTSNILVDSPSGRSLLYFFATFLAVMGLWLDKVFYDARFVVGGDDMFHRVFELIVIIVLATAILHIRTISIMGNEINVDAFAFCLSILCGNILVWLRYFEVYLFGVGQPVIKSEAKRMIKVTLPYVIMVFAATIYAGVEFYDSSGESSHKEDFTNKNSTAYSNGYSAHDHRWLAASATTSTSYSNDVPMYLILCGYIARWLYLTINVRFFFPGGGRHKEFVVPLNVDFVIHRNGEWNMLMLGESILSLLIVDVDENDDYFATFYSALLTIILLQYLHFRSQPHDAEQHAIRRNKDAGMAWTCFHMIYSAALIAIGAAFTLMVLEFTYTYDDEDGGHRRFLAGGGGAANLYPEDRRQRSANLFCGSLATIWFCLDCMTIFHLGLKTSHDRCHRAVTGTVNKKGILLVICRVALLVFMATLSQYLTDPEYLAIAGLFGVVLQLVLRKLGTIYLSGTRVHALHDDNSHGRTDPEDQKWPNVTHAKAHSPISEDEHHG